MLLYIAYLFTLLIININAQISVEMAYLKLAKKIVRFEITGYENVDNLNSNGECCAGPQLVVCTPCSSRLRYNRNDKDGNLKTFDIGFFTNNSRGTFYVSKVFVVNPDEQLSFQIIHTELLRGANIDTFDNFSTSLVGLYVMNGVWGIFGNTMLYYNVEIFTTNSYSSYYSVTFRIVRVTWIRKQFSDGSCCQVINSSGCDNACPFFINVFANENLAFASKPSTYNGNLTSYFAKAATGTISASLQQDPVRLRLAIMGYPNNKPIDEIRINSLRAIPNRMVNLYDLSGINGRVRIDLNIKYECRGYRGYNCKYFCHEDTKNVDCNFETGNKFCVNGASNIPNCNIFNNTCSASPCINGGVCSPLPSGFNCICPVGFKGRYCEEPSCESECKRGNCVNNKCVCEPSIEGDMCDTTSCPSSEISVCQNGGLCKYINGVRRCICSSITAGAFCEQPVCLKPCIVGTCSFVRSSVPLRTECVCANGFTGESCDIQPSKLVFSDDTAKIIIITVFSILCVLAAKVFTIMIFIKFECVKPSVNQPEYDKTSSENKRNSLVGL